MYFHLKEDNSLMAYIVKQCEINTLIIFTNFEKESLMYYKIRGIVHENSIFVWKSRISVMGKIE